MGTTMIGVTVLVVLIEAELPVGPMIGVLLVPFPYGAPLVG